MLTAIPAKEKWVRYVGALFGDRRLLDLLGPQIKYWTENSRGAIAAETVKMLSYLREPAALMLIDKMMRMMKNRQVRGAAEEALELDLLSTYGFWYSDRCGSLVGGFRAVAAEETELKG